MSPHLRSLHWPPLKQRIKLKWCLLIFKTLKFGLPPYFSSYFVPYTCKISTRRSAPPKNMLNRHVVPFNRNIHNPSCTLIMVLLLLARWSGIASLKKYVDLWFIIYISASIESISLSLSFSSIITHSNGLTFWILTTINT